MVQDVKKMYLAIDQYGNKTILPDKKYKTLREKFYCSKYAKVSRMYRDTKDPLKPRHVGYVLGQGHNNNCLWVDLFRLEPLES